MNYRERWVHYYLTRQAAGQVSEDNNPEPKPHRNRLPPWPFNVPAPPAPSLPSSPPTPAPAQRLQLPPPTAPRATDLVAQAVQARQRLHLSQQDFAAQLGISPRTLQDWEQGRRHPRGPAQALLRQHLERLDRRQKQQHL